MSFDFELSTPDYVTRATPIFTGTDNWSMSAWFKLESTGSGVYQAVLFNGVDGGYGQGFGMVVDNNVLKGLFPYVAWVGGSSTLSTGTWYHACLVRSSGTAQLYLDGSTAGSSTTSSPYSSDSNADTTIGARRTTTPGFDMPFDGLIAEVAMWDRALSGSEITALAGGAEASDYSTNLLFYKRMTDSGEVRTDEVDTYTNWATTGTPAYSSDHPFSYGGADVNVSASDSASVTDSPTISMQRGATASDSASVSDTLPSYSQTEPVSVSDLATIEIVYPDLLPTVSDSVSATDTPSLEPIEIVTNVSDTVSVSDSASISIQSVADTTVTATDTASVTDTPVLTVSDPQAIASDTVSVTDTPTVSIQAVPDLNVSASDTASIADTLPSYEYTEPVGVIDSPTVQPQGEIVTRSVSASDTINVDEVFQAAIEVNASVLDSVTVSDDPIISVVALDTPSPSVSDLVGVTDTPTVSVQPTTTPEVTASDSVSVNDSASVDIPLGVTVQENVSVTDTPNAKVSDLIMNISDSVSVSDTPSINILGTPEVSVSDSVSVSENTSINIYTPGDTLLFKVIDLGKMVIEI